MLVGPTVGGGAVTKGVGERPCSKTAGTKLRPTGVDEGNGAGGVTVGSGVLASRVAVGVEARSRTTGANDWSTGVAVGGEGGVGGGVRVGSAAPLSGPGGNGSPVASNASSDRATTPISPPRNATLISRFMTHPSLL